MIYLIFIVLAIVFSILYFKKYPFLSTNDYSMRFHSFFLKYFVPFTMAIHFADALVEITNGKIVAFVFQFASGILYLLLFVKLQKLEKLSLYLIIGLTVVFYGFNLISTISLANNNKTNFNNMSILSSLIWFGLGLYISLYYYQRRSIFVSTNNDTIACNDQTHTRSNEEANDQICYCRKCGAAIPSDSDFCPKCGEKI